MKLPWNPLIKELTCQALAMCDDSKMTPLSSSVDDGRADIPLEFSEKFAELIIQECAWQVLKDQQVPHQYQMLICERIRQHFGVEQ